MFVTFLFSLFSLFSLTWKGETVYLTYISFRDREAYYREKHDGAYRPVHRSDNYRSPEEYRHVPDAAVRGNGKDCKHEEIVKYA